MLSISETLDARRPELVLPQLRLILGLADPDRFVKPSDILLTDDIRHFAWNGEPDRPFISDSRSGQLHSALRRVLDGHDSVRDFDEIINENVRQKEQFKRRVYGIRTEVHPQIRQFKPEEIPTFDSYLQDRSASVARDWARRVRNA